MELWRRVGVGVVVGVRVGGPALYLPPLFSFAHFLFLCVSFVRFLSRSLLLFLPPFICVAIYLSGFLSIYAFPSQSLLFFLSRIFPPRIFSLCFLCSLVRFLSE